MESANQFSSRPDCNNTADVPSFTLRTALSAITFVFRSVRCRRTMIPGKIFTGFAKFQGFVSVNDSRIPIRLQERFQAPLRRSFCFGRTRLGLEQCRRCPFFISAYCSLQSNLFLEGEGLTYNDSTSDFHKLYKSQGIVSVYDFLVSKVALRTFASSIQFPAKFFFYTEKIGSTEYPSPAPRLHIGVCFEIHILH